jgi:hypothetical protein
MTDDRPRLQAPAGATDTHMHFYDTAERYPVAPTAAFLPPPARVADYRALQQRLGLARVVVVQPSAYGADNRCTMDAVAELGGAARAVVVVEPGVTDEELERLTRAGARGIRFHMLRGGVLAWAVLEEMAARVHPFGWHVQLQCNGRELPERAPMLERLPGDVRPLRELARRPARLRGHDRARPGPGPRRPRAHAVGEQLAPPRPDRPRDSRRRSPPRPPHRMGPGRSHPQAHSDRQPGGAVWVLRGWGRLLPGLALPPGAAFPSEPKDRSRRSGAFQRKQPHTVRVFPSVG